MALFLGIALPIGTGIFVGLRLAPRRKNIVLALLIPMAYLGGVLALYHGSPFELGVFLNNAAIVLEYGLSLSIAWIARVLARAIRRNGTTSRHGGRKH